MRKWTGSRGPLVGHHGGMSLKGILVPASSTGTRDVVDRFVQLLIGLFLYGVGIALMIRGNIGLSPWDVLSVGVTNHVPIGFGTATVCLSVVVLLLWIPLRQKPGLGTVLNALLVGPSADIGLWLIPPMPNVVAGAALFLSGLLVLAFATGIYIASDFGPGPRDGLMTGLVRTTGWKTWIVRTLIEGTVLSVGFLLGGPVGVGTVIFAFGVGPLIGWLLPWSMRMRQRRSAALATPTAR